MSAFTSIIQIIDYKGALVKTMRFASFFSPLLALNVRQKKNIFFLLIVLFLILFSYPIIRSTVDALFLDTVGAQKSPLVWIYSVIILALTVGLYNKLQTKIKIQTIFSATCLITFALFVVGFLFMKSQPIVWRYLLFILKEVYIILLVNMTMGLLNETVDYETAKKFYGPVGVVSGFGGILGGLVTSWMTYWTSTELILLFGASILILVAILFGQTAHIQLFIKEKTLEKTPLQSIYPVRRYVFWIVLIVALSQVCISLVNFKFNILFEQVVPDKNLKTRYLGDINTAISSLVLIVQLVVIPLSLRYFSNRSLQLTIPIAYGLFALWGFGLSGIGLLPIALTFIFYKGIDYSFFAVLKELFYFPLKTEQKYGAKYIIDMVVYRFAKGATSLILVFWQGAMFINWALALSLVFWFLCLIPIFKEQKKIIGGHI